MDIESLLQTCVEALGGKRVSDIIGLTPNFDNADFIIESENLLIEVKSLEEDKILDEKIIEKVSKLYIKELEAGNAYAIPLTLMKINTKNNSKEFIRALKDIYKIPIERLFKKASTQINKTKTALKNEKMQGLMILANNNHTALDPWHANQLIDEIIRKPQFSGIQSVLYITGAQTTININSGAPFGAWILNHRLNHKPVSEYLLNQLRDIWFHNYSIALGKTEPYILPANEQMLKCLQNKDA